MELWKTGLRLFYYQAAKYVDNPSTPEVLILRLIYKRANAVVTEITALNYHTRSR